MHDSSLERSVVGRALPALLLLLTVFGPISMDLYLPALPALTVDLAAETSVAQLTLTACLVGLAGGQLVAGPLSDRFGRRGILIVGIVGFIITSALCAISPTIELLVLARFAQGLAGGIGVVIAQAAGRDIYSDGALIRFYGRLTVMGGLAAVVGPLIGGVLTTVTNWRGLFAILAAMGAGILLTTLVVFRETLPVDRRVRGGFGRTMRDFRLLISDRVYLGAMLSLGFMYGTLFAYIAGSSFVLQDVYGLSPLGYALAFGVNSVGFMASAYLAGRGAEKWSVRGTLAIGMIVAGAGALGMLAAGIVVMPLWVILLSLFLIASGVAITSPPATTLALLDYPEIAGTASSLLGTVRFGFGAVTAPLVGVAGALSILPLGVVTTISVALAAVAFLLLARRPLVRRDRGVGLMSSGR